MFLALITVFTILALSGCAKPPTAEMENAISAVTRAENEPNVVVYAENTLKLAQNSLTRMNEAANNKRYDEAKILAQETANLAERAISEARTGTANAQSNAISVSEASNVNAKDKENASNLIDSVKTSIAEAEQALENAQKVKSINLNTNAIVYELKKAKEFIEEAEAFLAEEDYRAAENAAAEARSAVSSAMSLIAEAARESSMKK